MDEHVLFQPGDIFVAHHTRYLILSIESIHNSTVAFPLRVVYLCLDSMCIFEQGYRFDSRIGYQEENGRLIFNLIARPEQVKL